MTGLDYTVVIATLTRPAPLERVLRCLERQTRRPTLVVVVDASTDNVTAELLHAWSDRLPVRHLSFARRSSALQRNAGSTLATTPLIAFLDDDIEFPPEHLAHLTAVFGGSASDVIGVSGRESGQSHPRPRGLARLYYRLQAGYDHPHYGARLFGFAVNCVPCYEVETAELIAAQWLPSTCVVYRRAEFARERFPDFEEYSYMEDVHLSARMARQGRLLFHAGAEFTHRSGTSTFKRDVAHLAQHRMANRRRIAREILRLEGWPLHGRVLLHRLFLTAVLARARPPQWWREIVGTWRPARQGPP
jgi:GT2 family glycosyltransferase